MIKTETRCLITLCSFIHCLANYFKTDLINSKLSTDWLNWLLSFYRIDFYRNDLRSKQPSIELTCIHTNYSSFFYPLPSLKIVFLFYYYSLWKASVRKVNKVCMYVCKIGGELSRGRVVWHSVQQPNKGSWRKGKSQKGVQILYSLCVPVHQDTTPWNC